MTIFQIPAPILGVLIVGGGISFAVAGVLIVRRLVPHGRLKSHHDVADPILGAIAAVYAVLLAFVAVTVWQNFDKSNANVALEANYLADIYNDSEAFSPDFHKQIGGLAREYREKVVNDEWKAMARGEMSPDAERIVRKLWDCYTTYTPRTITEKTFFDESVRKLNLFRELRRQRLMDSKTGLQSLLWFVLIAGGVITISLTFFFGAENLKAQILMAVLLASTISLILFAILEMDFPFSGNVRISSEPFHMISLE